MKSRANRYHAEEMRRWEYSGQFGIVVRIYAFERGRWINTTTVGYF